MTNNREVYNLACKLHNATESLRDALFRGVLQRIDEAEGGMTAAQFEASAAGGGHSDGTAAWAEGGTGLATRHRRELARALDNGRAAIAAALSVASLYPPARDADDEDREALARLNGRAEPCCANCARTRRPDGKPRWEPIDSRLKAATTVGKRLAEPMLLCVWCVDRVRAWGRLPTPLEVRRHHEGHRVPWPDDVPRPADAS